MYFAIRDDDTSYFTTPNELLTAYGFISEGPVSLSVIPYAYPYHKDINPYKTDVEPGYYDLIDNVNLVEYLKRGINSNKFSIMLHGYSHEYRKISGKYRAEMIWKTKDQLIEELRAGKKHLTELFGNCIDVFVAPNNLVNPGAIEAIEQNGLNYCGTIWKKFGDRRIDFYYLRNYFHRTIYYLKYRMPYSGIYRYKNHNELYAHAIRNYDELIRIYENCKKHGLPFVVYTHYWMLNDDPKMKQLLKDIYEYAIADGCKLVSVSECFSNVN